MANDLPFTFRTRLSTGFGPKGTNITPYNLWQYNKQAAKDVRLKLTPKMVEPVPAFDQCTELTVIQQILKKQGRTVLNRIEREFYISTFGNRCIPEFEKLGWDNENIKALFTVMDTVMSWLPVFGTDWEEIGKAMFVYMGYPINPYATTTTPRFSEDDVYARYIDDNPAGLMSIGLTQEDLLRIKNHKEKKPEPTPEAPKKGLTLEDLAAIKDTLLDNATGTQFVRVETYTGPIFTGDGGAGGFTATT